MDTKLEIVKSDVAALDNTGLMDYITNLEIQMGMKSNGDKFVPLMNPFRQFFRQDELCDGIPTDIEIDRVIEKKRRLINVFSELYHKATSLNMTSEVSTDINGDEFEVGVRINRLIETVDDYFELVFRYVRMYERFNNPTIVPIQSDIDGSFFRVKTLDGGDDDERSPYQRLVLYFLNELKRMNMKRYKGNCMKQIMIGPYCTKAWKSVQEIKSFVYESTQKEDKYDMWKNLTSKPGNVSESIKHLTNCIDIQFPEIQKNRTVWSFNNGIYLGHESKFYEYTKPEFHLLDPTIVSSKFFDKEFIDHSHILDWYDIPTPFFQSILDYQRFPEDVSRWLYVFAGRLCFSVNDRDRWQVIPFFKGIARSGKSTLITKVFKKFYETDDVRTLSNNIEKKFGLWSIYDAFMFISPEVKGDLALEQAEFQSIVSGEDVSIARKNEKAISKEWDVPGILAGNEVPGYRDNSGSVLRRMMTWDFKRQVSDADPHLEDKLDIELPSILQKCIRAYLEYSTKYSDKDIWNVVPKYFGAVQAQIALVTNTLQNFLASEKVRYGKDLYVPQKLFIYAFNQHCAENNLPKTRFNSDIYNGPFSSRELDVKICTLPYGEGTYVDNPFIMGMDLVSSTSMFTEI
jgi:hypothetical protein